MGEVGEHLEVEIAPDQFAEPGRSACIALLDAGMGRAREFSDRDGAKPQVHAQVARPAHAGEVAGFPVSVDPRAEVVEQLLAPLQAQGQGEFAQVGGFKAQSLEAGNVASPGGGALSQGACVRLYVIGLQVVVVGLGQPGVLVGGEHGVGPTALGH
jgi:hypothetical protein